VSSENDTDRLLAEFREKAEALGIIVARVASSLDAGETIAEWADALGADRVVLSSEAADYAPGVVDALTRNGLQILPSMEPLATRDMPLGVSLARLAIAETGSALLSEPTLADRSVGMLTLAQTILCPTSALVASLDDAVTDLRARATIPGGSFSTLVTGPSRTADIERVLTVGVQGPGKIMTLFVDDLTLAP
jgi:L-lactate dehydrogenase complex protein LldG